MPHRRSGFVSRALAVTSFFFSAALTPSLLAQQSRVEALERGALLRVATVDGRVIEGRMVGLEAGGVRLTRPDGSQTTVARGDVASLEIARSRTGPYAKRGAVVGAIGGGLAGGLFLDALCSGSSTCGVTTDVYVLGGGLLAGALAGSLIGSLVGWAASGWIAVSPAILDVSPPRPGPTPSVVVGRRSPAFHLSLRVPFPD